MKGCVSPGSSKPGIVRRETPGLHSSVRQLCRSPYFFIPFISPGVSTCAQRPCGEDPGRTAKFLSYGSAPVKFIREMMME